MVEIGEICNLVNGRAFKPEDWENKENGGLPIIRIQNLNTPTSEFNYYSGEVVEKYLVNNGDLLFSWSGSKGTSFGAHIWQGDKAILNQHIFRIEYSERVLKEFFYHALNEAVTEIEENLHGGVGLVHITKGNMEKIKIPLPPLSIQQQIVDRIESYQAIINGAKQVVQNYKPQIDIEDDWEMVKLGEVCENLDSKRKPVTASDRKEGIYPYYGASGIVDYVDDYIFNGEYLLVSEDGANLLARVTPIAFSISGKTWVNNHAHILKFKERSTQIYIELYLNSINLEVYVTGAAQPKLNQANLNSILVPLPLLSVQQQIVNRIEHEQQLVNATKELIKIYEQKIKDEINKLWKPAVKEYEVEEERVSVAAEE